MATVRTRIGPADNGRKMTVDEFWEAEEEPGYRYELARGVLEVSEIPGVPHFQVVDNLRQMLAVHRIRHPGLILRIGHGSDVRCINPELETDRHPDLAIVFREGIRRDLKGHAVAPLGVEIVSPGNRTRTRDCEEKREDYLAVGLLEDWIVDPELRQVTVLIRREVDGIPGWDERTFRDRKVIESGLILGFAGTVDALWADMKEV